MACPFQRWKTRRLNQRREWGKPIDMGSVLFNLRASQWCILNGAIVENVAGAIILCTTLVFLALASVTCWIFVGGGAR